MICLRKCKQHLAEGEGHEKETRRADSAMSESVQQKVLERDDLDQTHQQGRLSCGI